MLLLRGQLVPVAWLAVALGLAAGDSGPADRTHLGADEPLPPGALARLGTVRRWQADPVHPIAFSPDGKAIALGSGNCVRLWEVATGKELRRLKGHEDEVSSLAFSPDGKTLASGSWDRTVCFWEVSTGKPRRAIPAHRGVVLALAFSPDGKLLASAGQDRTVRLWDAGTGQELRRLPGHQSFVHAIAFSPDGKLLASGSKDRTVRVWEVSGGKEVFRAGGHRNRVNALVFCPDGKTLISGSQDSTIRLWQVPSGKEVGQLAGYYGEVRAVALSPDGKTLAATCRDQSIYLWELLTGKERGRFRVQDDEILSVVFSPDGRALASSGTDNTILTWDVTGLLHAGRPEKVDASREHLEVLWTDLAGQDAARAYLAVWRLAAVPRQAVPFLRDRVQIAFDDPQRIARLIADLDSKRFPTRKRATVELEALTKLAGPALRKALAGGPSLEVRRRIEILLEKAKDSELPPAWVRLLRAVEVLEQVGTPEARKVLADLANGKPGARATREAKAALRRLAK
ncbi:MAG TPA: hypothetical protein VG013_23260 [Gemmataceae bacterium]|jgi:dipeptidyl aminopeptidase/acylaminoacyl peptidase|nr:hypothetical protein [Gemmataceae bacterium]